MIYPSSGNTPCQDKIEYFLSLSSLSSLFPLWLMPNLNWIKDNTALFEGLPPTPTKEQSKVNEGLSFG